jgi:riboflavin kinase/FMN adenylyltransferase
VIDKQIFIRGLHNLKPEHFGNVVTIGSFDGVHLGHQSLLKRIRVKARELDLPSLVMIFEPQPHEFFSGEQAPARLMHLREKVFALFDEGVDRVCCLSFNRKLREHTAEQFVLNVLVNRLGTKFLVVGDDFRYGACRTGNYSTLKASGERYDFIVTNTESVLFNDERISSTLIRKLLRENDFDGAAKLLGRPYTISGKVVRGKQLGRILNAPTANVHLHRYRSPLSGVFAVTVQLPTGEIVFGVANVGVRPTVEDAVKPILEVHLFDRNDDLYGQDIVVEFKTKLREEQQFDGLEQLKNQIQKDFKAARDFFNI